MKPTLRVLLTGILTLATLPTLGQFSQAMRGESKGITKSVTLAGHPLTNRQIYPLPMTTLPTFSFISEKSSSRPKCSEVEGSASPASTPTFYRTHFTLTATGDTFLDIRELTKGALWVNGHPAGRFWNIGPQRTLYVPVAPGYAKATTRSLSLISTPHPPLPQSLASPPQSSVALSSTQALSTSRSNPQHASLFLKISTDSLPGGSFRNPRPIHFVSTIFNRISQVKLQESSS
jgi:hypothetical protein